MTTIAMPSPLGKPTAKPQNVQKEDAMWLQKELINKARDFLDHPDSPRRREQVEALKAARPDADRHALQAALMPYEHLLPQRLRGRNQRFRDKA